LTSTNAELRGFIDQNLSPTKERAQAEGAAAEGEQEAGSLLSREPDAGLDRRTPGS